MDLLESSAKTRYAKAPSSLPGTMVLVHTLARGNKTIDKDIIFNYYVKGDIYDRNCNADIFARMVSYLVIDFTIYSFTEILQIKERTLWR